MNPEEMEKAMLNNMIDKTGKSLKEWIYIVHKKGFTANKDIVKFLKEEYSVGHFYAHLIARKSN